MWLPRRDLRSWLKAVPWEGQSRHQEHFFARCGVQHRSRLIREAENPPWRFSRLKGVRDNGCAKCSLKQFCWQQKRGVRVTSGCYFLKFSNGKQLYSRWLCTALWLHSRVSVLWKKNVHVEATSSNVGISHRSFHCAEVSCPAPWEILFLLLMGRVKRCLRQGGKAIFNEIRAWLCCKPFNEALNIWFPPSIEKQERLVDHSAVLHISATVLQPGQRFDCRGAQGGANKPLPAPPCALQWSNLCQGCGKAAGSAEAHTRSTAHHVPGAFPAPPRSLSQETEKNHWEVSQQPR